MKKHASLWAIPAIVSCLALSGCHVPGHQSTGFVHNSNSWDTYQSSQNGRNASKYRAISKQNSFGKKRPSLILSDSQSKPENVNEESRVLYRPGSKDVSNIAAAQTITPVTPETVTMDLTSPQFDNTIPHRNPHLDTLVGRKVKELHTELLSLQTVINKHDVRMSQLQMKGEQAAGNYYALIAVINADLQSGTTSGNPEIVEMWNNASAQLEKLAESSSDLGELSNDITQTASKNAFLQDAVRATFGLSGAIEEDHENLTAVEDQVNQSIVRLNRMLNTVNDEINRRNSYLRTERLNIQTLSLAIANGELYGTSMSSRLFARVADAETGFATSGGYQKPPATPTKRPLVIIRFDRPNIQYQQPLYTALSQALEKYPAAQFDIVAVSPQTNNPAEMALSSANARRNSEDVLRSMTQMGVPTDRISMGNANTPNIIGSEVHLYIH